MSAQCTRTRPSSPFSRTDRSQFIPVGASLSDAEAGDLMVLDTPDGELCGLAASDGGLIYRAEDGRIVLGYPEAMNAESIRLYRMAAQ